MVVQYFQFAGRGINDNISVFETAKSTYSNFHLISIIYFLGLNFFKYIFKKIVFIKLCNNFI